MGTLSFSYQLQVSISFLSVGSFSRREFTFGTQDEKIISWCLCKIYLHKDIIKELENTDILHSLFLDKFIEMHECSTFFSKRSNILLSYDLGKIFHQVCSKIDKRSLSLQFICIA